MKKALVLTALSSALLVSFPAFAADTDKPVLQASAAKPAKPPSDMFEALAALGKELKGALESGRGNPIPHFDKLVAHQYSDDTKAKLAKVFGSKEPLSITRGAADGGRISYTFNAPAHNYLDSNANTITWSELDLNVLLDKAGRNAQSTGSWGSFSIADKDMGMTVSDISMESLQRRNAQNIWLGKVHAEVGKVVFSPAGSPAAVLEQIALASNTVAHGAVVDVGYDVKIKAFKVAGEQVDDIHYAMRMMNIDMRALEKLTDNLADVKPADNDPAQQLKLLTEQLKGMAKSVTARGTALEIDDISAGFHGNRATIKGKVWLAPGSGNADFASMDKFSKKIMVRLSVRVPVALVTEVAKVVMAKQAVAKGETTTPEAIAQGAQSATDFIVGKMLNENMAQLDNGVLVALIEYKAGKLTCNGKEITLPKAPAKPVAAVKPVEAVKPDAG